MPEGGVLGENDLDPKDRHENQVFLLLREAMKTLRANSEGPCGLGIQTRKNQGWQSEVSCGPGHLGQVRAESSRKRAR
jgi:hypothetical protein